MHYLCRETMTNNRFSAMRKISIVCLSALLSVCCTGRQNKTAENDLHPEQNIQEQASSPRPFAVPKAPKMLGNGPEAAVFYAEHFWDEFDFSDTLYVNSEQVTETAMAEYINILSGVEYPTAARSIARMLEKAQVSKPMYDYLCGLYEKYLHDPNSPLMNEEYFITVLESQTGSPILEDYEKIRPRELLKMALKNRVGTQAADFTYTLASGAQGTLYSIKAPMTLIFINNPGCPACKEVRENISASQYLSSLIDNGTIKVLAIYPDEDLTEWRNYAHNMPSDWINGYDRSLAMRDRELYDLKAIPTVYLLDTDKRVILKDCMSVPVIEQTVYFLLNQNQ